jgi:2-polyprenyl-6-methoxyphenol hydroxylase-like FAD-dependent oxidoreductase
LEYLKTYNRCERPIAVQSQARMYLDKSGKVVHRVDMVQSMTSWDPTYYLLRAHCDGVPSDYFNVPPQRESDGKTEYRYDSKVMGIDDLGQQVKFRNQKHDGKEESVLADPVIGADGPSSTVRILLCPGVERKMADYCALRGTIPKNEGSTEAKEVFQERFSFFHDDRREGQVRNSEKSRCFEWTIMVTRRGWSESQCGSLYDSLDKRGVCPDSRWRIPRPVHTTGIVPNLFW